MPGLAPMAPAGAILSGRRTRLLRPTPLHGPAPCATRTHPDDLHHRRRWFDHAHPARDDHRLPATEPDDRRPMFRHLLGRRTAFHRQQPTAHRRQRQAPAGQPVQRGHRPGGDHVGANRTARDLLGTATNHADRIVQAEFRHHFDQESCPPGQRLDQRDPQIGSGHCKHDTGQTCTGAHINDISAVRDQLGHNRTVDQVPIPQPWCFARADQAADDAVGRKQFGVLTGQLEPPAKERHRGRRRGRGQRQRGRRRRRRPGRGLARAV